MAGIPPFFTSVKNRLRAILILETARTGQDLPRQIAQTLAAIYWQLVVHLVQVCTISPGRVFLG